MFSHSKFSWAPGFFVLSCSFLILALCPAFFFFSLTTTRHYSFKKIIRIFASSLFKAFSFRNLLCLVSFLSFFLSFFSDTSFTCCLFTCALQAVAVGFWLHHQPLHLDSYFATHRCHFAVQHWLIIVPSEKSMCFLIWILSPSRILKPNRSCFWVVVKLRQSRLKCSNFVTKHLKFIYCL